MNTENKIRQEKARDHAWRVFEERNQAFRVLYDTVMEVEGTGTEETFSTLCRNLMRISKGLCAALASYDPDEGVMVLESVCWRDEKGDEVSVTPGISVRVGKETVDSFKQEQVLNCNDHEGCLVNIFPDSELKRFASLSDGNCYRVSCVREGELIVGGMFQLPAGKKMRLKDMIDTYLNLAGMIIQRVYLIRKIDWERRQFLSIFDSIDNAIYVADPHTYEIIYVNRYLSEQHGKDLRGKICYREFQGLDSPCDFCTNKIILQKKGQPYRWEYYNPFLKRHYLAIDRIIKWPDGRDVRFELATDITDRKRTEDRLQRVVQVSNDLIYEWNIQDDSREWFGDIKRALGYDPVEIERTTDGWLLLIHPDDRGRLIKSVELHRHSTEPFSEEYRVIRKDGSWRYWTDMGIPVIDKEGRPSRWIGGCKDITERKCLEEELINSRKLESIGILAGGIAHDFNNIIAAILGNASLARLEAKDGTGLYRFLKAIEGACGKAQALTKQLLTFSTGGSPVTESIMLEELLTESAKFVLHGTNTVCDFKISKDLWPAAADPGQVSQVIHNLILNADQAMPDGGRIELRAFNVYLKQGEIPLLQAGKYLKIEVEDWGVGIPSNQIAKIFDPYFSTKEQGSGLGLTTVYSIIKKHRGELRVKSVHGKGTTFTIYLPASNQEPQTKKEQKDEVVSGLGRILLMDDDEMILEIGTKMLERLGYQVNQAADGMEAIEQYTLAKSRGNPFKAVIFDLTVPGGMGGVEALKKLKEIDPDVKALVSSGYSTDAAMAEYKKFGFMAVIPKPYGIETLSQVVAKVIG
ncbi:MAG: PAS domain-containing protein [Deltaproteobacteria bacterium]|nr:PAS domain-containing protein [Deltaproteobacteria bacterium]